MDEYGTAGNWGTLDQIMALQWVNDNIEKFGGDPDNITLGGESAGSFSTLALIMSPLADGLFQKAIMENGAITYTLENQMRLDKALEIGKKIAAYFGADDSPEGLEILRNADPMELWTITDLNLYDQITGSPYQTYPVYDGVVLPLNEPYLALIDENYNKNLTILAGNNRQEGPLFVREITLSEETFNKYIKKSYRSDSYQEVIDYYAAQKNRLLYEKASELVGLTFITMGIVEVENQMAKAGVPVYAYEFNYTDSKGIPPLHATEYTYAFGQNINMPRNQLEGDDLIVRDTMHAYWTNFIRTGNPNGEGLPEWPLYVEGEQTIMQIDTTPSLITRSNQEVIDFLAPRYFR